MPPIISINGYPGVGKLTIANELKKLFQNARVVGSHLFTDLAAAIYDRDDRVYSQGEYEPYRESLRREIFDSIGRDEPRRDVTWIFTDWNKSHFLGCDAISGCENGQATFVRVVMHCELEENLRRASSAERRGANSSKLTDANVLRGIRGREKICLTGYEPENELELDVTHLSPSEAAGRIYAHVKSLPDPMAYYSDWSF